MKTAYEIMTTEANNPLREEDRIILRYSAEEHEESISDKLFNAAETDLERAVAELARTEGGEDCKDYIDTVVCSGCLNGVSGMIYYSDTIPFYQKHKVEIQKRAVEWMKELGEKSLAGLIGETFDDEDVFCEGQTNQNNLAWWAFETVMGDLAGRIGLEY